MTRLRSMRSLRRFQVLALPLGLAGLLAACGSGGSGTAVSSTVPAPTTTAPPTTAVVPSSTTTAPPAATTGGIVFFLTSQQGDPGGPFLTAVWRPSATTVEGAVDALLAGPDRTGTFASPAITTAVPDGTRRLAVSTNGATATVDLTGAFASGGGSTAMFSRLGQLIYTVTAQPGIEKVALRLDGRPVDVFSSEGIVLGGPVGRELVRDTGVVPPVLVVHPAVGEPVAAGTVRLTGLAHGATSGRVDWSLTRGGEDRLTSGSITVAAGEVPFAATITPPPSTSGRVDLVVETAGFVRQIPFLLGTGT